VSCHTTQEVGRTSSTTVARPETERKTCVDHLEEAMGFEQLRINFDSGHGEEGWKLEFK